jgi:hypothetical protein
MWRSGVAGLCLLTLAASASAQGAGEPPSMAAHRLASPIRIDGRLDEPVYASAPATGGFVQQEPFEGQPATERTEAWIFFDETRIYVSARCYETAPARRVANEMRRDTNQLRQNDTFAVLFDTFHDRRNGFLFYANPIGGFADSQITDEGPPNVDWNTVWDVKTADFDGGWTIEMAIPFKSLRYGPGRDQTWGVNLRRVVRWKNEWSYLAQVPRALTTFRGILKVSSAGTLTGLQVPPPTRNLELKPFTLASVTTDRTVTPAVSGDPALRVGGDAKYGLTPNLTLDLTVNTDFAQVEVDEQQVNLTRFNLFFPERRDFFLEGAGIFAFAGRASSGLAAQASDTPNLFFSRRIGLDAGRVVPIDAGGRLTGRVGRVSLGAISVRTGDDEASGSPAATMSVLRAKADILRRSALGAMFTHRTATPGRRGSNEAYGLDTVLSFYQNVRFDGYVARTVTEGRGDRDLSYRGFFDYNADRYGVQVERLRVEPDFLPELGFLRRTDLEKSFGLLRLSPRPQHVPHVRRVSLQASANYITNAGPRTWDVRDKRLDTRELTAQVATEFTSSDVLTVGYTDSFERLVRPFAIATGVRIPVGGYDFGTYQASYAAGQQRKWSGTLVYEQGTFYDGRRNTVQVNTARVEITPRVSVEPSLSVNRVRLPAGHFTATVARARGTFTMTPRMFVSGIVQYNSSGTSFGSNLRFRWEYKPGSELFVVYTDDYDTEARAGVDALRNRAFVVKVNRLFRP